MLLLTTIIKERRMLLTDELLTSEFLIKQAAERAETES